MNDREATGAAATADVTLIVQRTIRAPPARLFDAWTQPAQLRSWWGPAGIECSAAEVDLRVGGRYRLGNRFPDGSVLWISGEFTRIDRPHLLAYTWQVGAEAPVEQVTVRFEAHADGTQVIITHERIPNAALRDRHQQGWAGCLDGLAEFATARA